MHTLNDRRGTGSPRDSWKKNLSNNLWNRQSVAATSSRGLGFGRVKFVLRELRNGKKVNYILTWANTCALLTHVYFLISDQGIANYSSLTYWRIIWINYIDYFFHHLCGCVYIHSYLYTYWSTQKIAYSVSVLFFFNAFGGKAFGGMKLFFSDEREIQGWGGS